MQASPRQPADPNLLRVLVVGEMRVGKTLLIRRLCHQVFGRAEDDAEREELDALFAAQWGPTIGFEVDCLVRDVYGTGRPQAAGATFHGDPQYPQQQQQQQRAPGDLEDGSLYGLGPQVSYSVSGTMIYRRADSLVGGTPPDSSQPSSLHRSAVRNSDRPARQTVELYELGGTRGFSDDCALPLPLMDFDGVIFVYDRANTGSTTSLAALYRRMAALFSEIEPKERRPGLMLVGTELGPSGLASLLGGLTGDAAMSSSAAGMQEEFPSDDALLDSATRMEAEAFLHRQKKAGRGNVVSRGWWRLVLSLYSLGQLAAHPSLLLSEKYQEERGTRSLQFLFGLMECAAGLLMLVERTILWCMSVALFGLFQDVVTVRQPSVRAALGRIKEDPLFMAQCSDCRLYDRVAFESSADDLTAFFDALQRRKVAAAF